MTEKEVKKYFMKNCSHNWFENKVDNRNEFYAIKSWSSKSFMTTALYGYAGCLFYECNKIFEMS